SAAQSSAVSYPFPKIRAMEIPIKAITEVIASLLWCQASALREVLFVSKLFFNTNLKEVSFHKIMIPNTSNVHAYGVFWGVWILCTALYAIITADRIRKPTTKNVIKGSIFPCP